ncbi:POT family-domain-containing protein [Fimicolochytrium jonesii]|uniref:POT family-domain-containing protein n=1 Tax=Fimicolochytrium jonesii TaxID=1396493 RepID=UPI0022FF1EC0|nr:POT family-domain-containing protein [Fimicolochytrium jonesii]KAI8826050.1 POT family-domain-containing protein [Fimicolochytrium jonesii]
MPRALFFIIPNELGERFCYYGISPILKPFLKKMIGFDKAKTDSIQHIWKAFTYFTPLGGAAISDSYLDKYKTIVILSVVYLAGLLMLTITSRPGLVPATEGGFIPSGAPLAALFLISVGTGGIKPCVSSHGGDQFLSFQKQNLNKFYNYFYMAINVGSIVSGFIQPKIAEKSCFGLEGGKDCYSWAFAVCAIAFAIALGVFAFGKFCYRVVPPAGVFFPAILARVAFKYTLNLFRNGFSHERARIATSETESDAVIIELFDLLKVLFVISPSIIFWLGFDQNGTSWQDTSDQMDHSNWLNSETTNAVINPIWIIILAPIFANFLYPAIEKRVKFGLLRRMVVGQFFAGISFIIMAVIQQKIDDNCVDETWKEAGKDVTMCMDRGSHTAMFIVPYFFITVGEVLVSISGLNFTYTEVGKRSKSSCAALWLLGTGIGNLVAAALFETPLGSSTGKGDRPKFFYAVAGIIFAAMFVQAFFNRFYTYKADRKARA